MRVPWHICLILLCEVVEMSCMRCNHSLRSIPMRSPPQQLVVIVAKEARGKKFYPILNFIIAS